MEFIIEAKEETIAATKAANINPRRPLGIIRITSGYALSVLSANTSVFNAPNSGVASMTAAMPGKTIISGISNFKAAAKTKPF